MTELLLAKGAITDVEGEKRLDSTALCPRYGRKDLAEVLLLHGADVHAKEASGMTPLHVAAFYGTKEVVHLLISKGAAIEAKDRKGQTALQYAVTKNQVQSAILLHWYGSIKAHPALAALSPEPNIVDRYKWRSALGSEYRPGTHTNATVTEVIIKGEHVLKYSGQLVENSSTGIEGDTPGCHVRIHIAPDVGETAYAGLTFQTPCTLYIREDCTLMADEEGIVVQDKQGTYWISRPAYLDNKKSSLFFPVKGLP